MIKYQTTYTCSICGTSHVLGSDNLPAIHTVPPAWRRYTLSDGAEISVFAVCPQCLEEYKEINDSVFKKLWLALFGWKKKNVG